MSHHALGPEPWKTGSLKYGASQGPGRHLYFYVASDLHARVKKAATAAGVKAVSWIRHTVRQITIPDFPASRQEKKPEERSHDSHVYGARFMVRPDEPSRTKLQQLIEQFGSSRAEIIRQLIVQAMPGEFSLSWQIRVQERRAQQARRGDLKEGAR